MEREWSHLESVFEAYLNEESVALEPFHLYDPVRYILSLKAKRVRPLLLLCAVRMFRSDWKVGLPAALGVEVFHNFTLAHDDIMDEAERRRGALSMHRKYGLNQAILSGDVMMLQSLEYIGVALGEGRTHAFRDFVRTGIAVCEGQQMDVDFEKRVQPTKNQYLDMIRKKTAILPAEALRLGGVIGGATETQIQDLYDFGLSLGMAFQIQDDILDAFGDPEMTGKVEGGDIRQNKKTLLYIVALEKASSQDKNRLKALFSSEDRSDAKVNEVKEIWMKYQVKEEVSKIRNDHHNMGVRLLDKMQKEQVDVSLLRYIGHTLISRLK